MSTLSGTCVVTDLPLQPTVQHRSKLDGWDWQEPPGASFFDYIITDCKVTPEDQQPHYSEHFAYMPTSYQINSKPLVASQGGFSRERAGLPEDSFIYCCFCSNYKIDANIFQAWMGILKKVPESVLWIMTGNPRVEREHEGISSQPRRQPRAPDFRGKGFESRNIWKD